MQVPVGRPPKKSKISIVFARSAGRASRTRAPRGAALSGQGVPPWGGDTLPRQCPPLRVAMSPPGAPDRQPDEKPIRQAPLRVSPWPRGDNPTNLRAALSPSRAFPWGVVPWIPVKNRQQGPAPTCRTCVRVLLRRYRAVYLKIKSLRETKNKH